LNHFLVTRSLPMKLMSLLNVCMKQRNVQYEFTVNGWQGTQHGQCRYVLYYQWSPSSSC
jgi:hypothetical protein